MNKIRSLRFVALLLKQEKTKIKSFKKKHKMTKLPDIQPIFVISLKTDIQIFVISMLSEFQPKNHTFLGQCGKVQTHGFFFFFLNNPKKPSHVVSCRFFLTRKEKQRHFTMVLQNPVSRASFFFLCWRFVFCFQRIRTILTGTNRFLFLLWRDKKRPAHVFPWRGKNQHSKGTFGVAFFQK